MENKSRLSTRQKVARTISVIVAGVGAAACAYSLLLQVQEIGTFIASVTWFSGLAAVVFALAGYAVSCDPGRGNSHIPIAIVCGLIIMIPCTILGRMYLYVQQVILIALIFALIEGIVLIYYHYALKRDDPDAL